MAVTSTYFEGQALANEKAARGYSRDQRPDCKQVNLGLVVTPEGLPVGYEIFAGNTADVTTVRDMVGLMENKYGQPKRIWVLDRGLIEVTVERDGQQRACGLKISERAERAQWAAHAHGAYLLRTNCLEKDPAQLWRWYMQLTQAEDAFRIGKSDLHLRPATGEGSGDGAEPGRGAAHQGSNPWAAPPDPIASGGPVGSSGGRTAGKACAGPARRPETRAKCSGEKRGLICNNPSKSAFSFPELTNLG